MRRFPGDNLPTSCTLGSSPTSTLQYGYVGLDGQSPSFPFGALRTIQWQAGTNPRLVDRTLGYDPAGNVTQIVDAVNAETITYGYDDLNRLLSASAPSGQTYTYDSIGNIATKNGYGYCYQDPAHKHATTATARTSYAYDANSSMTNHNGQTITYDPLRRPVRVDTGGGPVCRYAYDGDGNRRKRLDSNGTIHYVSGAYEVNLGNGHNQTSPVVTKYYAGLSRRIAFRKAGTLSWLGADHLGGTIRVTDGNFNALDGQRYTPFGISRDSGTGLGTDHLFTSQIQDQSVGLYWYGSRAYDSWIGRFCCPDSIVPSAGDPQSLNRYSYVRNNPCARIDPTGHLDYGEGMQLRDYYKSIGETVVVDDRSVYFPTYHTGTAHEWRDPLHRAWSSG